MSDTIPAFESYLIPMENASESGKFMESVKKVGSFVMNALEKLISLFWRGIDFLRSLKARFTKWLRGKRGLDPEPRTFLLNEEIPPEEEPDVIKKKRYKPSDSKTTAHKTVSELNRAMQNYTKIANTFCQIGSFALETLGGAFDVDAVDYTLFNSLLERAKDDVSNVSGLVTNLNNDEAIEQLRRDPRYLTEMIQSLIIGLENAVTRVEGLQERMSTILQRTPSATKGPEDVSEFYRCTEEFTKLGTSWLRVAVELQKIIVSL